MAAKSNVVRLCISGAGAEGGLARPAGHSGHCYLKKRNKLQCNRCKHQASVTAGTILSQHQAAAQGFGFLAIYHISQSKGGISSAELGRRLGRA